MKLEKIIFKLLLCSCLVGACNIEDVGAPQPTQLRLESGEYSIRIYPGEETNVGLTLRWIDIASEEYHITLSDEAGETSLEIEDKSVLDGNIRSLDITNEKLLEYISTLGITYKENSPVPLMLSMIAKDKNGIENRTSSSVSVMVVASIYMLVTSEQGEKEYIEMLETSQGVFTWTGELGACDYCFTTRENKEYPLYAMGADENSLVYIQDEGEYKQFSIIKPGKYQITVDKTGLTVNREFPIFEVPGLWVLGGACNSQGKFDLNLSFTMQSDYENPEIWTYTGTFYSNDGTDGNSRSFKVAYKERTWDNNYFFLAPTDWTDPRVSHSMLLYTGKDYKWTVFETGIYKLTINLNTMKIFLEKSFLD